MKGRLLEFDEHVHSSVHTGGTGVTTSRKARSAVSSRGGVAASLSDARDFPPRRHCPGNPVAAALGRGRGSPGGSHSQFTARHRLGPGPSATHTDMHIGGHTCTCKNGPFLICKCLSHSHSRATDRRRGSFGYTLYAHGATRTEPGASYVYGTLYTTVYTSPPTARNAKKCETNV